MQKAPEVRWPLDRSAEIAVKVPLPAGEFTFNQTAIHLEEGEIGVFLRAGGEPVVVRSSATDLSFELDGLVQGLAQLFYSRPWQGDVWLVRMRDLDVGWAEELDGAVVSVGLTCVILDPPALVAEAPGSFTDADLVDWIAAVWGDCFREHAIRVLRREDADDHAWEEAAATAEAWATPRLAARGLKIEQRLPPDVRRASPAPKEPPRTAAPTPAEALDEAMMWVRRLQEEGALVLADGVVPEMAAIAVADALLAAGQHLPDGLAAARAALAPYQSSASSSVQ
jgi:hypothetical protein